MIVCHPKFKEFPWKDFTELTEKLHHVATPTDIKKMGDKGSDELYYFCLENNVTDQWVLDLLKPTKTIWNRIGELAAHGTECPCCLGYRAVAGFFIGTGVGVCLMYLIG